MSEETTTTSAGEPANPAEPSPEPAAGTGGTAVESLRAEMVRDRFDAVAARAGVDAAYVDVALGLFESTGQEPSKANMAAFVTALRKEKPALFGPQPASTAPTPPLAVPSAPAPGGMSTPFQQWQALEAAGRKAEAEAYYRLHRRSINRQ